MYKDQNPDSPETESTLAGPPDELFRRIEKLNESTEDHFLSIGLKIQEFSERASDITGKALTASRILSGDDLGSSAHGLSEMIDKLEGIFERVDSLSESNIESLRSIGKTVVSVEKELGGLGSTSRNLKMLALSTKIQSTQAGRGSADFMQLGLDIARMSDTISSKAGELLSETSALSGFVGDVEAGLHEIQDSQKFQTRSVLDWSRHIILSMNEMVARSRNGAERIKEGIDNISGSVSEVITSIQYQDITKQSLEKVLKELNSLGELPPEPPGKDDCQGVDGNETMDEIMVTGQYLLQSRALERAGELVGKALETAAGGLEVIASNISSMVSVTRTVVRESSNFQEELEVAVSSVTSFLEEVVQSNREMSRSMNSLGKTVDGMSEFTQDIEMISTEVELISLNARVTAAQAGVEGVGMGVIADAVKETATESDSQRSSVVTLLNEIASASARLKGELENTASNDEDKLDQLMRELGVFLDALRHMQKNIVTMLSDIDNHGREVINDIESFIDQVRKQSGISRESSGIAGDIRKMAFEHSSRITPADLAFIAGESFCESDVREMDMAQRLDLVEGYMNQTSLGTCPFDGQQGDTDASEVTLFDSGT